MAQPEHPHEGGAPGQSGQTPAQGAPPPGQVDKPEKPDEEEDLEITHPIVDPDAPHPDQTLPGDLPYVEHHDDEATEEAPA